MEFWIKDCVVRNGFRDNEKPCSDHVTTRRWCIKVISQGRVKKRLDQEGDECKETHS